MVGKCDLFRYIAELTVDKMKCSDTVHQIKGNV